MGGFLTAKPKPSRWYQGCIQQLSIDYYTLGNLQKLDGMGLSDYSPGTLFEMTYKAVSYLS